MALAAAFCASFFVWCGCRGVEGGVAAAVDAALSDDAAHSDALSTATAATLVALVAAPEDTTTGIKCRVMNDSVSSMKPSRSSVPSLDLLNVVPLFDPLLLGPPH